MKMIIRATLAAIACTFASGAHATTVIDTTGSINIGASPIGLPNASTAGQTFTSGASDTYLNSFSLYLWDNWQNTGNTLKFKGYIATWDGSKATGVVYTSGVQSLTAKLTGSVTEFAFASGVNLQANTQYVAFLSAAGLGAQPEALFSMPWSNGLSGNPLAGGGAAWSNTGTDFAALLTDPWTRSFDADLWFKAQLFNPNPNLQATPIPGALPLFASGFAVLGLVARRRKKQAA